MGTKADARMPLPHYSLLPTVSKGAGFVSYAVV